MYILYAERLREERPVDDLVDPSSNVRFQRAHIHIPWSQLAFLTNARTFLILGRFSQTLSAIVHRCVTLYAAHRAHMTLYMCKSLTFVLFASFLYHSILTSLVPRTTQDFQRYKIATARPTAEKEQNYMHEAFLSEMSWLSYRCRRITHYSDKLILLS